MTDNMQNAVPDLKRQFAVEAGNDALRALSAQEQVDYVVSAMLDKMNTATIKKPDRGKSGERHEKSDQGKADSCQV